MKQASKIKDRVQRGELAPIEALNLVNMARVSGQPYSERLMRWCEMRCQKANETKSHGCLFASP